MSDLPMNIQPGDTVIVTCDNWFYAPDGREYRAVFGTVRAARTAEDTLGIRPNGKSTNWYLEIGNMTIAGCQIHYLVKAPSFCRDSVLTQGTHEGRIVDTTRACGIYDADRGQP